MLRDTGLMEDIWHDLFFVSSWTCEMWMALGADPIVASQIIEMVMEKLAIMAPYVDKKESMIRGGTTKVATNPPLAVSHKHSEILGIFYVLYLVLRFLPKCINF